MKHEMANYPHLDGVKRLNEGVHALVDLAGELHVPWTSLAKDISTTSTTPHPSSVTGINARPPGIKTINFKPAEFFGAGARCSHLHIVNPALITPESEMIRHLVSEHVDNTNADFAIMSTADNFKDYVKSYFAGTIASALAYLAMIGDGYVWADHFENLGGGNTSTKRTPDFVFARPGAVDVALTESKGTRSATAKEFDKTVNDGYVGQIEPHLGYTVGSALASHGYSIGSRLTSTRKADINIHHTDAIAVTAGGGPMGGSISTIQRHNYATAFRLSHSERLSREVRSGDLSNQIPFFEFEWLGRKWLTSDLVNGWYREGIWPFIDLLKQYSSYEREYPCSNPAYFAIERDCVEQVLRAVSEPAEELSLLELAPMSPNLMQRVRSEGNSALFPDGLAISYTRFYDPSNTHAKLVVWLRKERAFEVFG
jgi:hypothetical protein